MSLKKWKCLSCTSVFSSIAALSRHKKTHSEEESKFLCSVCSKRFDRKDNFVRHQDSCMKKGRKKKPFLHVLCV